MKTHYLSVLAAILASTSAHANGTPYRGNYLSATIRGDNVELSDPKIVSTDSLGRDSIELGLYSGTYMVQLRNPAADGLEATLNLYNADGQMTSTETFPALTLGSKIRDNQIITVPLPAVSYSLRVRAIADPEVFTEVIDDETFFGRVLDAPQDPSLEQTITEPVVSSRPIVDPNHSLLAGVSAGYSQRSLQDTLRSGFVVPALGYVGEHNNVNLLVLGQYSFHRSHPEKLSSTGFGLRARVWGSDADLDVRSTLSYQRQRNQLGYPVWIMDLNSQWDFQFAVPVGVHTSGELEFYTGEAQGVRFSASGGPVIALPDRADFLRLFADFSLAQDSSLASPLIATRSGVSFRKQDIHVDLGFLAGQQVGAFGQVSVRPVEFLQLLGEAQLVSSGDRTEFRATLSALGSIPLLK